MFDPHNKNTIGGAGTAIRNARSWAQRAYIMLAHAYFLMSASSLSGDAPTTSSTLAPGASTERAMQEPVSGTEGIRSGPSSGAEAGPTGGTAV